MRYFIVPVIVLVLLLGFLPTVGATPPAGPVTIMTAISFAAFPFSGTFTVTAGSALLGCAGGTFVDFPAQFPTSPPPRLAPSGKSLLA